MPDNFEKIIKENKNVILVSFVTSLLTMFLVFLALMPMLGPLLSGGRAAVLNKNTSGDFPAEESRIVSIVEESNPAVVSIVVSKDVPIIERYYEQSNPFGDFFNGFFGGGFDISLPKEKQNGTERRDIGGGSGFFVSADGLLVTNRHVVDAEGAEYTVFTNDGKKYDAKIVAKDTALDIAVLRVSGSGFTYLEFGDSEKLKPGQSVIAIGNALAEFRNSVSVGVISGLSRSIVAGDITGRSEQLENVIQTDAAINPGNSGGPLLDINGKVVGVNVAVEQGAENIGFALPANAVKEIVASVKNYGEIVKPYIGVRYVLINEAMQEKNDLSVDYGALVIRGPQPEELAVIPGSPADKAGIVENDIILEVDGVKVEAGKSLASLVRSKKVGDTVILKVLSKGVEKTVTLTLQKAPKGL